MLNVSKNYLSKIIFYQQGIPQMSSASIFVETKEEEMKNKAIDLMKGNIKIWNYLEIARLSKKSFPTVESFRVESEFVKKILKDYSNIFEKINEDYYYLRCYKERIKQNIKINKKEEIFFIENEYLFKINKNNEIRKFKFKNEEFFKNIKLFCCFDHNNDHQDDKNKEKVIENISENKLELYSINFDKKLYKIILNQEIKEEEEEIEGGVEGVEGGVVGVEEEKIILLNENEGYENIKSILYSNNFLYFIDIFGFFYSISLSNLKIEKINFEIYQQKIYQIQKEKENLFIILK